MNEASNASDQEVSTDSEPNIAAKYNAARFAKIEQSLAEERESREALENALRGVLAMSLTAVTVATFAYGIALLLRSETERLGTVVDTMIALKR